MRYKSCDWISGGLDFRQNSIVLCCFTYMQGYDEYELVSNYFGERINWEELFKRKRELTELQKKGQSAKFCQNCVYLEERDWYDDDTINCLIFNHWTKCNSACIYCEFGKEQEYYGKIPYYDIVPILEDMEVNGILKAVPGSFVSFGGGEPAILKNFGKIIKIVERNGFKNIRVNSSGIKYSEAIAQGLDKGIINVCISPDAGSKEKYLQIKRTDAFKKVWENIGKYVKSSNDKLNVKIKYIIIPGYNDTKEDVDDFFMQINNYHVKSVCISVEKNWAMNLKINTYCDKREKRIYELMDYFKCCAEHQDLELEIYSEGLAFEKYIKEKYLK